MVAKYGKSRDRKGQPTTRILRYAGEVLEAERRLNYKGQTEVWLAYKSGTQGITIFHEVGSRVRTFEPDPTVGERLLELVIGE